MRTHYSGSLGDSHRPAATAGARWRQLNYEGHGPQQTTLYRPVQQHTASFVARTEGSTGSEVPRFIKDEFDAFLAGRPLASYG